MAEAKKPVKKPAAAGKKPVAKVASAKKPTAVTSKPAAPAKVAPAVEVKAAAAAKPAAVAKKPVVSKATKKAASIAKKEGARGLRKSRIGKVVSNKMNKTIVVSIVNKVPHPLYGKVVVTTTKFKAHDENNECSIGDTVEIVETRPLSRDKYFRLLRIIEKVK